MAKAKLSTRILNAYRALRGEPWPAVIEGPKITYTRPDIVTIGAEVTCPIEFLDLQGPEVTDGTARQDVARLIGQELLNAGAIQTRRVADLRDGYLRYTGRVRVVMPGEEDDNNGQE